LRCRLVLSTLMGDTDELKIQDYVSLPALPELAVVLEGDGDTGFVKDEVINILSGNLDGSMFYAVAWDLTKAKEVLREGWISGSAVNILADEEQAAISSCLRLPMPEVLQRSSFVEVAEDWRDPSPNSLSINQGEVLQVSFVQDGWAYGWPVKVQYRSGWFRLCDVRYLETSMLTIGRDEVTSLSLEAYDNLVDLLQSAEFPNKREVPWEDQMPDVVVASEKSELRDWRKIFEAEKARNEVEEHPEHAPAPVNEPKQSEERRLLFPDEPSEESCSLLVCKEAFQPPKSVLQSGVDCSGLLPLDVGDLVRVVSLMLPGQAWYCGYLEGHETRGWFPARNVKPLDEQLGKRPLLSGETPPGLPQVPKNLIRH